MTWDKYFFKLLEVVKEKSKDPSTKCGAIIVGEGHEILSTGYNDFPRGVIDKLDGWTTWRRERPIKYKYTEHAERNAIYNAARIGIPLMGTTMYITGAPCTDCSRAIIQAGIRTVKFPRGVIIHGWEEDWRFSKEMLLEAGIEVVEYEK